TGGYTYQSPPTITTVVPNLGSTLGGQSVTITGTILTTTSSVTIRGTPATAVTVVTATTVTCTTPAGSAGAADVVVTTPGGSVTATGGYIYQSPPTITAILPNVGPTVG